MVRAHSLKAFSKLTKYLSELPIICQMSESQTAGLWRRFIKNKLDVMMFRHNEVNFEAAYDDHQNT